MWNLYEVTHPIGHFFGFARNEEEAREHWGHRATITLLGKHEEAVQAIINARAQGKSERVFIAI